MSLQAHADTASEDDQRSADYLYKRKFNLLTPTETGFFRILRAAINKEHYYIVPQVHLSTLFESTAEDRKKRYGAFQHINRKSVDYVVCTLKNLNPVCAIELDDDSHLKAYRRKRDKIVNSIFQRANLPLLRIHVLECNNVETLKNKLAGVPIPNMISF